MITAILFRMKTQRWLLKYPLITMVATYVVITLLAGPQLADTLGGEVARTALAAVVTIGALLLLAPAGLRWMATAESLKDLWARRALLWVALCALAACCANGLLWLLGNTDAWGLSASPAASAIADGIAASAGPAAPTLFEGTGAGAAVANPDTLSLPVRAALLLACCFATAVFEEGFFRGIAVPCAARRTQLELEALKSGDIGPVTQETYRQMSEEEQREITNVSYSAAVFSAILFGAAHLMGSNPFAGSDATAIALLLTEAVGKAVQAGMFGYVMAALMLRTQSVFAPMVVHFLFDVLYFAPVVLATGMLPATYATGSFANLAILALTIAALVPAVRAASSWLKGADRGRG